MPMYDFKCTKRKCAHQFEKIVSKFTSDENPITVPCPECGSKSVTFMPPGCRSKVKFLFNYIVDE